MNQLDESDQLFPAKTKEEHCNVIIEPRSNYLLDFLPEKANKEESHAVKIANVFFTRIKTGDLIKHYRQLEETLRMLTLR